MTFQPSAALGGGSHTVTVAATATDSSGNALASPRSSTFSVSASVVQSASSVTKNVGGSPSGSISSFSADDSSYYKVPASNRVVQYTLTFSNVPADAKAVQLTFKSKNSRSVTQTITTNWTGATAIDTRSVSSTEVLVQKAIGDAGSTTLTVTIREQGNTSSAYSHYGDWARISYTVG
jgi:hypothetical protein